MSRAEKEWEKYGETSPYYAVYMVDEFKSENLDDAAKQVFFQSGEVYLRRIWKIIETHFVKNFSPNNAIDFGCGVGRVTIPLAKRSLAATGVDISKHMLREARANAENSGITNVIFQQDGNNSLSIDGEFDFIHSYIVFQHINPKFGESIFQKLVKMLEPGGIGVIHFSYADSTSNAGKKIRYKLYRDFSYIYKLRSLLLGKTSDQFMPIYSYDLNKIFLILQQNDCHNCHIQYSFHGIEGIMLFFQKKREVLY